MKRKRKEMSIKHVVNDGDAGIYISTDILNKTITIGRGLKRMCLRQWEADRLEFLLKRQMDRLAGDYPKETSMEENEFLICPNCSRPERSTANFCGNCGYDLAVPKKRNDTAFK